MLGLDVKHVESSLDTAISDAFEDLIPFGEPSLGSPSSPPVIKSNLYVGSLPADFTSDSLVAMFAPFGRILRCKVGTNRTGKNAGYGFVQYENEESANKAISALNGLQVQDKKLHVSVALGRAKRGPRPKTNLYFSGLPLSFVTKDLTKMCESFGRIIGARVLVNPVTNLSRGYGFVRFDTHENALKAITALNGTISPSGTEPLIVKFARDPTDPEHPSQRRLQRAFQSTASIAEQDLAQQGAVWLMSMPGEVNQQGSQASPPLETQMSPSERGGRGRRRGRGRGRGGILYPPSPPNPTNTFPPPSRFTPLRNTGVGPLTSMSGLGTHPSSLYPPPRGGPAYHPSGLVTTNPNVIPLYSPGGLFPRGLAPSLPTQLASPYSSLTSRFSTLSLDPTSSITVKAQDGSPTMQGVSSTTPSTGSTTTPSTILTPSGASSDTPSPSTGTTTTSEPPKEPFSSSSSSSGSEGTTIFVTGLNSTVESSEVQRLFEEAGKILAIRILDPQNGIGSALVCFEQERSAQHAIESLNQTKLPGALEALNIKLIPGNIDNVTSPSSPSVIPTKLPDPIDPGQFVYHQQYFIPYYTYGNYPYAAYYSGSSPVTFMSSSSLGQLAATSTTGAVSSDPSSVSPSQGGGGSGGGMASGPAFRHVSPTDLHTLYHSGRLNPSSTAYQFPAPAAMSMSTPMYVPFSSASSTVSGGSEEYFTGSSTVSLASSSTISSGFYGISPSPRPTTNQQPGSEYYYSPEQGRFYVHSPR